LLRHVSASGARKRNRYSDWLRAGRPRGQSSSPGRVKNFLHVVQTVSDAHQTFYSMATESSHLQLMPRSRKCGATHPLLHTPSWRSAELVTHRDNFTSFFYLYMFRPHKSIIRQPLTERNHCTAWTHASIYAYLHAITACRRIRECTPALSSRYFRVPAFMLCSFVRSYPRSGLCPLYYELLLR
jgi:hypothetical protein